MYIMYIKHHSPRHPFTLMIPLKINDKIQALEVVFTFKKKKQHHPDLIFNGIPIGSENYTKHLGALLDCRLRVSKPVSRAVHKPTKSPC